MNTKIGAPPPPLNNHSVEGRPNTPATPQAASHKRRLLLSTLASGTAASPVIGSWSKPIVQSFLLPSHAQSSPGGGTPSTSSTTPTPSSGGSPSPTPRQTTPDPNRLTCSSDTSIVCFRDKRFKDPVLEIAGLDANNDNEIQVTEAQAFNGSIIVNERAIADLSGIEKFTALTALWCFSNQLSALDVSKNIALTDLRCDLNELTELDVSKNTALTTLICYENQLTTLDVSENMALTRFECDTNPLKELDVSKNTALTTLQCFSNQLSALDVSKNTALTTLLCNDNQLTALDVSKNTALTSLNCSDNQLSELDISDITALATLDCTNNPALRRIVVADLNNIPATGWSKDASAEYVV